MVACSNLLEPVHQYYYYLNASTSVDGVRVAYVNILLVKFEQRLELPFV